MRNLKTLGSLLNSNDSEASWNEVIMKDGTVHHHTHCDCSSHSNSETQTYAGHGVRFYYPRNWELSEETGDDQTTITVQSPGTSYWMVSLFEDRPEPERIIRSVLDAYESLYEELDVYQPDIQIMGFPAVSRELDFVCLDLVTSAAMIAFQAVDQSVLVMFQGEDRELEATRPLMDAITQTLIREMDNAEVESAG